MGHYKSNLRDLEFNLFEVFGRGEVLGRGHYAEVDQDTAREMLKEVSRLAEQLERLGVVLAGEVPDQPLPRLPLATVRQVGSGALDGTTGRVRGLLLRFLAHPREYAGWLPTGPGHLGCRRGIPDRAGPGGPWGGGSHNGLAFVTGQ